MLKLVSMADLINAPLLVNPGPAHRG
jgi:hypothetical protein